MTAGNGFFYYFSFFFLIEIKEINKRNELDCAATVCFQWAE
jgi:hypothetical protein